MIKTKLGHINRGRNYKVKKVVRSLLNNSGFSERKKFYARKVEGVIIVRFK